MARINVILECDKCLEEFQKEISRDAKNKFNIKDEVIRKARKEGWHVGAKTLCPNCNKEMLERCMSCKNYENKSMCIPVCIKKDIVVEAGDFCCDYKSK